MSQPVLSTIYTNQSLLYNITSGINIKLDTNINTLSSTFVNKTVFKDIAYNTIPENQTLLALYEDLNIKLQNLSSKF